MTSLAGVPSGTVIRHLSLRRRLVFALAALLVGTTACTVEVTSTTLSRDSSRDVDVPFDAESDATGPDSPVTGTGDRADPTVTGTKTDSTSTGTAGTETAGDTTSSDEISSDETSALSGGGIDASLDRDDIDCSDEGLGSDDTVSFVVAHVVVDGDLGAVCFGESDDTLVRSWQALAAITPPGQLRDLGLFGGFVAGNEDDGTTLAFVNTLDDAGSLFQMSVNLDEANADPNELLLTMAHEFSHVFTATSAEIDRFARAAECNTYFNGEGCYAPASLMAEWVELFWGDGLIDEIDPNREATVSAGEARCAINSSFFGSYAASNPEEDFAEAFSAYVFRLDANSPAQQEKLDWFHAQPGLTQFRQRADDAGYGPLVNNFDRCG